MANSIKNNFIIEYYSNLQKIQQFGGDKKETAIRSAFHKLLNQYCASKDLLLVDELRYKNTTCYPDGTIKDALRLDWGYWEAKDEDDDLDKEIAKKLARGYPSDNIIFEDSQTAVLYQNGGKRYQINMKDPLELQKIIDLFLDYQRVEIVDFRLAISQFSQNIPQIVKSLRGLIEIQTKNITLAQDSIQNKNKSSKIQNPQINLAFVQKQAEFLELCRQAINPTISVLDINEMLIQHILTEEIFLTVFDESSFHRENNIAKQLFELEQTFLVGQTKRNLLNSIQPYYKIIKARASEISNHHEKQKFLKVIYQNFYRHYNPDKADTLGVVYTPNEIVRFIIEGCNQLSYQHFGKFLEDRNVKILDPATGTGTFITELIDYLPKNKLKYKYQNELFCNEIAILPYYVANLNIEFTYRQKMDEHLEFDNISLVDTLDNFYFGGKYENSQQEDMFQIGGLSLENITRIKRQNDQEISIILGNPPYNANQMNFNNNNANRIYPQVDERIKQTYIAKSTAQKTKVYDMYSRFFRWASDRLKTNGIVAFVTNSSFVNSRTFDGFRKDTMDEFDFVYVMDCGGNIRAGETDGNVFDIMTGVAICFLIKKKIDSDLPEWSRQKKPSRLYYARLQQKGKENKLQELSYFTQKFEQIPFESIMPDSKGNWLNQTDNDWESLMPLTSKSKQEKKETIFELYSNGVATNRDYWVYDLNRKNLIQKVKFFIQKYNSQVDSGKFENKDLDYSIKWSRDLVNKLRRKTKITFDENKIVKSQYRPFVQKWFYAEKIMSDILTQNHYDMFGQNLDLENEVITTMGDSSNKPFFVLGIQKVMDSNFVSPASGGTRSFPLYRYHKQKDKSLVRVDNITDWALEEFRKRYENTANTSGDKIGDNNNTNTTNTSGDKVATSLKGGLIDQNTSLDKSTPFKGSNQRFGGINQDINQNSFTAENEIGDNDNTNTTNTSGDKVATSLKGGLIDQNTSLDKNTPVEIATKKNSIKISPLDNVAAKSSGVFAASIQTKDLRVLFYDKDEIHKYPANIKLVDRAKEMAKNMTKAEKRIWFDVLKKLDTKWIKQRIIGSYIIDFFCFEIGLAIEIDGESHNEKQDYDKTRTDFLNGIGILVIRFSNKEVLENLEGVFDQIKLQIENLKGTKKSLADKNSDSFNKQITKNDIFCYIYAVLHNSDYRSKYQTNLKQDFPRIPFFDDFWEYSILGKNLMDLHLDKFEKTKLKNETKTEMIPELKIVKISQTQNQQKFLKNLPILKLNKKTNEIILDNLTKIIEIPVEVLEYKLGNRSAVEWVLDQYKPKKEIENSDFDDYDWQKLKPDILELLQKVVFVSQKTMELLKNS